MTIERLRASLADRYRIERSPPRRIDPTFDPLRSDARLRKLVEGTA